jgi:hypothetical protein
MSKRSRSLNNTQARKEFIEALTRQIEAATDSTTRSQFASEIGSVLALGYLKSEEAKALSRAAGRMRRGATDFVVGYWSAISEMLSQTYASLGEVENRAAILRAVVRSRTLEKIILVLRKQPQSPTDLAAKVANNCVAFRIGFHLRRLEELGVVEPLIPKADKKNCLRQLTALGHHVALELPKLVKSRPTRPRLTFEERPGTPPARESNEDHDPGYYQG